LPLVETILAEKSLMLEGALSHFAQSDETDKTFARLQLSRFNEALVTIESRGIRVSVRHLCNSGGFLDLPEAHFDMVRMGILPLGVFPSSVCRRIPGVAAVMSVKARIAATQWLESGDTVGYGMRYTANEPRRIAVLPIDSRPTRTGDRRRLNGCVDRGHHGYSRGEVVGYCGVDGPRRCGGDHGSRHREAEELGILRCVVQLAGPVAADLSQ
jgi:hypothetical protein